MALVTKLKEYRERDDLKQAELAEQVGVRRETGTASLLRK